MDLNNSGISRPDTLNAGAASHVPATVNRMESFSSYCFGESGRINRSRPRDIPSVPGAATMKRQPLRGAFAKARQSQDKAQSRGRFMVKGQEDEKQVATLLKGTVGLADGIAGTADGRRFLVQHKGNIFNFSLDAEGELASSALVHPLSSEQCDFASVPGQFPPVFQRMEGARHILDAYLSEKNSPSRPDAAAHASGAYPSDMRSLPFF